MYFRIMINSKQLMKHREPVLIYMSMVTG